MTTADDLGLTPEEAALIVQTKPLQYLARACVAGLDFRLEVPPPSVAKDAPRFPEALVLSMIERGWLLVLQAGASGWGMDVSRPYTVMLSKEGERARVRLMSPLATAQPGRAA